MGFDKWCRNKKIVGLYGIDTRALTQRIRELGAPKALVHFKQNGQLASTLVHLNKPFLRLPNLAIHMNPNVNTDGLKLNRQTELPLLLSISDEPINMVDLLANELSLNADDISAWELHACDTQAGTLYGLNNEFYANSQLDNLAAIEAQLLVVVEQRGQVAVDHALIQRALENDPCGRRQRIIPIANGSVCRP